MLSPSPSVLHSACLLGWLAILIYWCVPFHWKHLNSMNQGCSPDFFFWILHLSTPLHILINVSLITFSEPNLQPAVLVISLIGQTNISYKSTNPAGAKAFSWRHSPRLTYFSKSKIASLLIICSICFFNMILIGKFLILGIFMVAIFLIGVFKGVGFMVGMLMVAILSIFIFGVIF